MDKLGIIRQHHWKERLKISKIAKFKSDLLKTNEDKAPQFQSREILQTRSVWWGAQICPLPHPSPNVWKKKLQLYGAMYHFQILQFY